MKRAVDWISDRWRSHCLGDQAFWRRSGFWLIAAAIVLPFGWLLFALKLQPVPPRARDLRRDFYPRRDS